MRKIKLAVTLAILLLVVTNAQITNVAIANFTPYTVFLPEIVIKSDGSVIPETEFINHTGNVYTLTGDISNYSLVIQCSNITLDGKGHIISGSQQDPNFETVSDGLSLDYVTNVTVRDLEIAGFNDYEAIRLRNCSECTIVRVKASSINLLGGYFNTIVQSAINYSMDMEYSQNNTIAKNIIGGLTLFVSHNNLVTENNITSITVQFCDLNKFYRNNFLSTDNSFQYYFSNKESFWDNGSIGNYWFDYLTRYPNASEIGSSGIWNTPYAIDQVNKAWINGEHVDVTWILGNIIDHYPLMAPVDHFAPSIKVLSTANKPYHTSTIPLNFSINEPAVQIAYSLDGEENITIAGNMTLTGLPNGYHNVTVYTTDEAGNTGASETFFFNVDAPEPFPLVPVAVATVIASVVVGAGLLVYHKKRGRGQNL